jgi:hypothetical protein
MFCGDVFISSNIIRCPFCNGGNIRVVPFRDDIRFSFEWLNKNGFGYCEELVSVVK